MKRFLKPKFAFTLSEVLIALTVIGVVAALTVSNVVVNVNASHAKTALKKVITGMEQAIALNINSSGYDCSETTIEHDEDSPTIYKIFEKHLSAKRLANNDTWSIYGNFISPVSEDVSDYGHHQPRYPAMNSSEILITHDAPSNASYFSLPDGIALIFPGQLSSCGQPRMIFDKGIPVHYVDSINNACIAFVDINGPKGPNQVIGCDELPEDIKNAGDLRQGVPDYIIGPTNVADDENESFEEYKEGVSPVGSPRTCTVYEKSITDVYPVVFFNDKVYPATYAAMTVYLDAQSSKKP